MSFEQLLEAVEHVPAELERNFTLMRDLDKRINDLIKNINNSVQKYKETKSRSKRNELKKETNEFFEKLNSYSDDKIELSLQTYELIDKNIRLLTDIGSVQADTTAVQPIGFDMPLDPNEPKYCICRGVSYGEMIACDNKECHIEWFHYPCVGLRAAPKGKWYCGQCFNISANKKNKPRTLRRAH